jgi:hypothetical protein
MTMIPLLATILVSPVIQATGERSSDVRVAAGDRSWRIDLAQLEAPIGHRQPTLDDLPPWLREEEKRGTEAKPTRVFVMSQESRRRAWEKKQQRLEAERQKRKELARAAQLSAVSSSTDSDSNQVTPEVSAKNDVMSANQNSSAKPKQSLLDRWRRLSRWWKI